MLEMTILENEVVLKEGRCELCKIDVEGQVVVVHILKNISNIRNMKVELYPYHRGCFETKRKLLEKFNISISLVTMKEAKRMQRDCENTNIMLQLYREHYERT